MEGPIYFLPTYKLQRGTGLFIGDCAEGSAHSSTLSSSADGNKLASTTGKAFGDASVHSDGGSKTEKVRHWRGHWHLLHLLSESFYPSIDPCTCLD